MGSPTDRKYTREHEWIRVEDGPSTGSGQAAGRVGITDYAQDQLGDIVYVDLPPAGTAVQHMAKFGEIESVKAVSELYSPVSGEVIESNQALADKPELVNGSPYDEGWMIRVSLSDPSELDKLLKAPEYDEYVAQADARRGAG